MDLVLGVVDGSQASADAARARTIHNRAFRVDIAFLRMVGLWSVTYQELIVDVFWCPE